MGTICSSIFNKSYVHYRFTDKVVSHPVLDKLIVIQDDVTSNLVYGININLETLELQDQALLERHQLLTHSNILRFEGFKKINNQEYVVLYESFECTLEEEIQRRKAKNKPFTEQEILGILQNMTSALSYFQNKDIYHGQVTSETIVKKGDEYKLLDLVLFEKHMPTYQQALLNPEESKLRLLSPELKEALAQGVQDPGCKKYKQDIYSLGVIILDAMNLDIKAGYSTSEKFAQAIRLYSEFLIEVVTKMVQESELLRIDAATCNKIVENMYYGFTVTENSERGPFPSSREIHGERVSALATIEQGIMERQSTSPADHGQYQQQLQGENNNTLSPVTNFFNSIEIREGVSLQEKLPSVVQSFIPGLNLGAQEAQKERGNIGEPHHSKRYKEIDPLQTLQSVNLMDTGIMNSVTDTQFYKELMREYPGNKGNYFDSKMSTNYAPDERVHTFGSTYRVTTDENENILSEKSKTLASPPEININAKAPVVTSFIQAGNNSELNRPPLASVQLADLNLKSGKGLPLAATSLNNENLLTKETYATNSMSQFYDPSESESVNFKDLRNNKSKRRAQAVLISDSYQDSKDFRNLLSSDGLENMGNNMKQYQHYKSPQAEEQVKASPQFANIVTIDDYRANENHHHHHHAPLDYKEDFRLKGDTYGLNGLSTLGSSASGTLGGLGTLGLDLKFLNNDGPGYESSSNKYKKHHRTKTMYMDLAGSSSGGKGMVLSQDFSTGNLGSLHFRNKPSISESLYKTSTDLRHSQAASMYKTKRTDSLGGRSMGYALEHLRNEVKHSFLADSDNFLEKRLAPHKRRTSSNIIALQQTIDKIKNTTSTINLNKMSTLQSDFNFQDTGLMSQVMSTGTLKKSLNMTLPKQGFYMHSRHASEIYEDNSKYDGELQGDLRHGQGRLIFKDGRCYEGNWKLGKIDGYGVLYSPTGFVMYEGEWRNNKYEGDGVVHNEHPYILEDDYVNREFNKEEKTWVKYEGELNNDRWNGYGKLVFSNGDVVQGMFKMDKLHGKASYSKADGMVLAGEWQNNILVKVF